MPANQEFLSRWHLLKKTDEINGQKYAPAIIEAKYSITKDDELAAAHNQVRGYALHLNAKYVAVASREKIWLYSQGNDRDFNDLICSATWEELKDPGVFQQVKRYLGPER